MVKMNGETSKNDLVITSGDAGSGSNSKDTLETLHEMSQLLKTGLDFETLSICFKLIENGVNPEILANVIVKLRKQVDDFKKNSNSFGSHFS